MKIRIRKELNDIIEVNETIINALKGQKARQDSLLEKYKDEVMEEINIPSNLQRNWARNMRNFIDNVISAKVLDYEILKKYQEFIKQVIEYESQFLINQKMVQNLEYCTDMEAETVMKLEKDLLDFKKRHLKLKKIKQKRIIRLYQNLPENRKKRNGFCVFCGKKLKLGKDLKDECIACNQIPFEEKPFLKKRVFKKYAKHPPKKEDNKDNSKKNVKHPPKKEEVNHPSEKNAKHPPKKEEVKETPEKVEKEINKKKIKDVKKDFQNLMQKFDKQYKNKQKDESDILKELDEE